MIKKTAIDIYEEKSREIIMLYVNGEIDVRELLTMHHNMYYEIKAMEREQIEEAYWEGGQDVPVHGRQCQQYYNETYKGGEQ
ncbi:MAG: hypothetical protein ACRCR2_05700 [Fusobacteriaceae bacterium]